LGENSHADEHPDSTPSMRVQPELKKTKTLCLNSSKRPGKVLRVRKQGSDVDLGDLVRELFSEFY